MQSNSYNLSKFDQKLLRHNIVGVMCAQSLVTEYKQNHNLTQVFAQN